MFILGFINNRNASRFPCPLKELKSSFANEPLASPRRLNWASINSNESKRGMRRRTNKIKIQN